MTNIVESPILAIFASWELERALFMESEFKKRGPFFCLYLTYFTHFLAKKRYSYFQNIIFWGNFQKIFKICPDSGQNLCHTFLAFLNVLVGFSFIATTLYYFL